MATGVKTGGAASSFFASAAREWNFLRHSPWELALATWFPWLLMAVLAWLLTSGVPRRLPIAVVDQDHSAMSRELVRLLDAAPALRVAARPAALSQAWPLARSLKVYAVVYVPRDASREVQRGRSGAVFAYFNASYLSSGQAAARDIGAAVQELAGRAAQREVARNRGPRSLRAAPVLVQTTFLFNSARSTQYYLLGLCFPLLLHFALCLSLAGAFGRELRDRTAGSWLASSRLFPAIAGKAAPYLLLFTLYGALSLVWLSAIRGAGVSGSAWLLLLGQALMYVAYASSALLFVGATKSMGTALSATALYCGTALTYSGITFPSIGAPLFARVWTQILPYTPYNELQMQQLSIGAPWTASVPQLLALALFVLVPGSLGVLLYGRAARNPAVWGRR